MEIFKIVVSTKIETRTIQKKDEFKLKKKTMSIKKNNNNSNKQQATTTPNREPLSHQPTYQSSSSSS